MTVKMPLILSWPLSVAKKSHKSAEFGSVRTDLVHFKKGVKVANLKRFDMKMIHAPVNHWPVHGELQCMESRWYKEDLWAMETNHNISEDQAMDMS